MLFRSNIGKKTKTENIHRVAQVVTNEDMQNAFLKQLPAKCLTKKKKVQLAENGLLKMMLIVVEKNQVVKARNLLVSAHIYGVTPQ